MGRVKGVETTGWLSSKAARDEHIIILLDYQIAQNMKYGGVFVRFISNMDVLIA